MMLLVSAMRHLFRQWRLNLALLAGLALAAGLLAGLPAYAQAMAAHSLHESLRWHNVPAERNFAVTSTRPDRLTMAVYAFVKDGFGDIVKDYVEVHETTLDALPAPPGVAQRFRYFHLWSFNVLEKNVRLVAGQFPVYEPPRSPGQEMGIVVLEAAVGADAARQGRLHIGDVVTTDVSIAFKIVGIVEPLDPQSDIWWNDLDAFRMFLKEVGIKEIATLSLLLPPRSIVEIGAQQVYWRIMVDSDKITMDNIQEVQSTLARLQAQLQLRNVTLTSSLPKILADYQTDLATTRMALFLLTAQAFVFILYTLGMVTSFLLERSQGELATLVGRGSSRLQVTLVFALEGLVLALLAALLGPLLARGALAVWSQAGGAAVPSGIQAESWILALIAAGFGWLAIVVPVYATTRRTLLEWQARLARPERWTGWQRMYLDLFLLVIGGVAYWQLSQSGSFVMSKLQSNRLADPFLLLGSTLLLIAAALIFLRAFPYLLGLIAWLTKQGRGLVFSLGLARLARAPLGPSKVVLLISLAAGLSLFTNAFIASLGGSQWEVAHALAGADLRLARTAATADQDDAHLPGVLAASPVFRATLLRPNGTGVLLLAVDPQTFAQVAHTMAGTGEASISTLMQPLSEGTTSGTLPAILSQSLASPRDTVGGQFVASLGSNKLTFVIQGFVGRFPTMLESVPFIVTNLPALAQRVAVDPIHFPKSNEAWLTVDPDRHAALVSDPRLVGRILGDAQAELHRLQANAMAQGTSGAFHLNTLVLAVLSVAGFILVQSFSARQRTYEFSLLRAMGLAPGQLWTLLVAESALVVGLGLLAGTAIGYGLTRLMLPYLSRALTNALAGVEIRQILFDWPAVARLYAILAGSYALALAMLLLSLLRTGLHRVLRLGEE